MGLSWRARAVLLSVMGLASTLVLGCEGEVDPASGGAGPGAGSTRASSSQTSNSSGAHGAALPPECGDSTQNPFQRPGCREAIQAGCLVHTTEDDCINAPEALFSQFRLVCSWSKVVRFADPSTCAIDAVSYRCDVSLREDFVIYHDPCEVPWTDIFTHWSADLANQELIKSSFGTPVVPEEQGYYRFCGDRFSPPEPQPICSCTEIACTAN